MIYHYFPQEKDVVERVYRNLNMVLPVVCCSVELGARVHIRETRIKKSNRQWTMAVFVRLSLYFLLHTSRWRP
jgi:hypothetical protein